MSDRDRKHRFERGPRPERPAGRDHGKDTPRGDRADHGRRSPRRGRPPAGDGDGAAILYGWHPVTMALANPNRTFRSLWLTENAARRLADENIDTRVTPELVRPDQIDR